MSVLVVLVIVCSAINQVQFRGRYCRYSFTLSLRFISAVLCGGLHKNGTRRSLLTTFCPAQVSTSRVSLFSSLALFALQYCPICFISFSYLPVISVLSTHSYLTQLPVMMMIWIALNSVRSFLSSFAAHYHFLHSLILHLLYKRPTTTHTSVS